jgi:nucleoid-associated protein YgaU
MSIPFKLEKAILKEADPDGGGLPHGPGDLAELADLAASTLTDVLGVGGLLTPPWSGVDLHFKFNPDKLTLTKTATYKEQPRTPAEQSMAKPPPAQYTGSPNRTLSFNILLDEWDAPPGSGARDVKTMVDTLQLLMDPKDKSPQLVPQPPQMNFHWGKFLFKGFITKADAVFTLFRQDGSPARAEVSITMTEHVEMPGKQNPTSGGPAGRRSRMMIEGDNLQLLSYREYGKSGYWRALAETNGIDDPLSVRPGQRLLMPSREDARALR